MKIKPKHTFKRRAPLVSVVKPSVPMNTHEFNPPDTYKGIPADIINNILDSMKINLTAKEACEKEGINPLYFANMVADNIDGLAVRVKQAKLTSKVIHLKRILKADKGWQASAWFLERTDRKHYGKEVTISDGDGDKQTLVIGDKKIKF